jgi:hypothetical protein
METQLKFSIIKKKNNKIINFLKESSGTRRSIKSFSKNRIIFLVISKKSKILGCIPLEPRTFKINKQIYNCYFITNAFLKKKYQNSGYGTKLLEKYNRVIGLPLFSYRQVKKDQAYNWYKKNKFRNLFEICTYELNLKKFQKKFSTSRDKDFKLVKINSHNKKLVKKIIKFRKSNLYKRSLNLYYYNYYQSYFSNFNIFFKKKNKKSFFMFCSIVKTNLGDNKAKFEIVDQNLTYQQLLNFLYYFINSKYYNSKYKIKFKCIKNSPLEKKLNEFFIKKNYKSNLNSNISLDKKNYFNFNSIEYV